MLPTPHAADVDWLIFEQSGVLTTAQATRFVKPWVVRSNLRRNRWRRICRGVLLAENGQLRRDQQLWVAVLAAGASARLAGSAAAAEGGVTGLRAEPIDVLVPGGRHRSIMFPGLPPDMTAVRVHRTAVMPERHRHIGRPPRTTVARAVVDGAAWARDDREARDLVARAHQQGRVTVEELRAVLADFPRIRRHRLLETAIADAAGGATALSEIDLVTLCRKFRISPPDLQRCRVDGTGRRRYVDAYWAGARLLVEVDGSHHLRVEHWAADMLRQNQIWISGDRILRFPAALVRAEPATVATQIRAALRAANDDPAPAP
jgi:hypothetical protein